jgi:VanZ family protein
MLSAGIKEGGKGLSYLFKKALLVVLAGAALSSFLELAQYYFIPGRVAESADVIANTLGTILGVLLFAFRLPFRQNATSFDTISHSNSGNSSC